MQAVSTIIKDILTYNQNREVFRHQYMQSSIVERAYGTLLHFSENTCIS